MKNKQIPDHIEHVAAGDVDACHLPAPVAQQRAQHPNYPRTCLSCGSRESLDGSVPCGH
jgi:hypothetical protein